MSLVSVVASALYAALPQRVRCPSPRRSEGIREFDALMAELDRDQAASAVATGGLSAKVTRTPGGGPARALVRRAHH